MREPEIDEHGLAARPEHDVRRLDVEMDDVLAMDGVERDGYPGPD
jgi:hypothetical protein